METQKWNEEKCFVDRFHHSSAQISRPAIVCLCCLKYRRCGGARRKGNMTEVMTPVLSSIVFPPIHNAALCFGWYQKNTKCLRHAGSDWSDLTAEGARRACWNRDGWGGVARARDNFNRKVAWREMAAPKHARMGRFCSGGRQRGAVSLEGFTRAFPSRTDPQDTHASRFFFCRSRNLNTANTHHNTPTHAHSFWWPFCYC